MDIAGLAVEGNSKEIYKVHDLHDTNYYEPFEHAKPKKKKKKINQKAVEEDEGGVTFHPAMHPVARQAAYITAPEYDHPLGPATAWNE